jgi:GNAT superfamily N-acetyltransferase
MITIRNAAEGQTDAWLELRHALWPESSLDEHRADIERFFAGTAREPKAVLLAEDGDQGKIVGLAELSIRSYAEGCRSDRVAFLEGWYVRPEVRRRGAGRALIAAAEGWGLAQGCTELASDTQADNAMSRAAHRGCGFAEISVLRCFKKELSNKAILPACDERTARTADIGAQAGVSLTMSAGVVVEVLGTLANASVQVWLDGGWGVDALLGEQTRDHRDLDVILSLTDAPRLQEALLAIGFRVRATGFAATFVLADEQGREIDVHPIVFDRRGYGFFGLPDGRRWPFPPAAFAGQGQVGDRRVRCLSADAQVQCHGQGYRPAEKDLHDMQRLQERFGVALPLNLCRSPDD